MTDEEISTEPVPGGQHDSGTRESGPPAGSSAPSEGFGETREDDQRPHPVAADLVAEFRAATSRSSDESNERQLRAARALIADAAGRHHIEERSVVYPRLGPDGWQIDAPTFDGWSLEGYDDGPLNEACDHPAPGLAPDGGNDAQAAADLDAECRALRDAAALIDLPDVYELTALLAAAGFDINTTATFLGARAFLEARKEPS